MKRQAVVITALACQTDYLLLDEAFDGLDPTMRIIVKRMLVDAMIDRNLTTIISSHNLKKLMKSAKALRCCIRVKLFFPGIWTASREIYIKFRQYLNLPIPDMPQYYSKEELAGTGVEILPL